MTILENNYEYLTKQLEQIGYSENLQLGLLNKILLDYPQFSIKHKITYDQDIARVSMQFKKSHESGMYLFKNYTIEVEKANNIEAQKQTFHVEGDDIITLKEAYNLLQGRAIHKELNTTEGNKYNAWIQLDYKNTNKNGSFILKKFCQNNEFDLSAMLDKLPIKDVENMEERKRLIASLEGGNRLSVTYMQGDIEKKLFIEAAPQFRSIHIYDVDMKRLKPEHLANKQGVNSLDQTYNKQFKRNISEGGIKTTEQQKTNKLKFHN